jgi:hypothetical protein
MAGPTALASTSQAHLSRVLPPMKIAFVMPNEAQKQRIEALRQAIIELMPYQRDHFEHLVRSWGITKSHNSLAVAEEALKRTLRDRP